MWNLIFLIIRVTLKECFISYRTKSCCKIYLLCCYFWKKDWKRIPYIKSTSLTAKSTSPGLLDMTGFLCMLHLTHEDMFEGISQAHITTEIFDIINNKREIVLYFICSVICINKQWSPIGRKRLIINSISMILGSNECLSIELVDNWLIVSSEVQKCKNAT